ncbi:MAG: hypothetical protein BGO98_03225 [Myxococcales bacterium 68-20]|nr:MAG: hypothetical protein BGO98_03225 [Myxococcales bacterium 68-20]
MGTIIRLPSASRDGSGTVKHLSEAADLAHAVHFYEEPSMLFENVAKFLAAGLDEGDRVIVIATTTHREGITRCLGAAPVAHALASRQLTMLDAHETLATFMVHDEVDPDRFRAVLEGILEPLRADAPNARIRAFGEMVDVLWKDGNSNAALRLEELWNEAASAHSFTLLCAYVMGNFYGETNAPGFTEVCARHTHVLSTEVVASSASFPRTREGALEEHVRSLETELHHRKGLEVALREALRDRSRVEAALRESVARERNARALAEENDRFKEQFLAVLGHDLRNPLNTILTTTRLMVMRTELSQESNRRLDRVISSGVRMQRMIEQILDVTSDRLSGGIPIMREPAHDVASLAAKVVAEVRLAHPTRHIELLVDGACLASIDPERIEQVLRTLVANAVAHGAVEFPVRVMVTASARMVRLEVHNGGPPIDADQRALLFDPFKRDRKTKGRSEGLGLGLYIAERIVHAHDGTLELQSSIEGGTRFRVALPRGY